MSKEIDIQKYIPIFLVTFVNVIGFTLLFPVLTEVSKLYVPDNLSSLVYGALLSSYALFQFLASPVLGSLSDKYGRRPILFLSQLGTTLSWVIFGSAFFVDSELKLFGVSLPLIIIALSRIVDGITGGNVSVAQAWISDVTSKENKAQAFGMIGAVFGFGLLIGPTIGGFSYGLYDLSYLSTAIIALLISVITLLFIFFRLPESLSDKNEDEDVMGDFLSQINLIHQIKRFRDNKLVKNILTLRFFYALVFASYVALITILLENDFDLSPQGIGLTLSIIGTFSIFNQLVFVKKTTKKIGDLNTVFLGSLLTAVGLIILTFISPSLYKIGGNKWINFGLFMINAYIINLAISLSQPTFKSVLTNNVSDKLQGKITGLDESLLSFGRGLMPVIAGFIYGAIGSFTFVFYSIFLVIPLVLIYKKVK